MNGIPVIKSKLVMPQLPSTVTVSGRLQLLIQAIGERSRVVVTAPAGYGKTTLITTALNKHKTKGDRICWYRLDEADRDLPFFYAHLMSTLFPEEEKGWEEARGYLAGCGDLSAQRQYINAMFCQELWAFHNKFPASKTYLVLDDYHHVQNIAEINSTIQFFMDNLPEDCIFIISSRCETDLLTMKRRLERNILEIRREELCITSEELPLLIEDRTGIVTDEALLQKIMLHTEGWPAGIILICQLLNNSNAAETGFILDRPWQKELLFQYIVSEILTTVEHRLLHFLVKAAILTEFTAGGAEMIFDEENALQLLEKCEHKGLFIQKIYGAATTYRFHSLFREALQQIQPQFLTAEEINNYHLKAAAYYIEHQIFDRAIEHFILCGNVDRAVELVVLVASESVNLLVFEAVEQFRLWFKLLPEDIVSNNGYLLYIKSFLTFQKSPADALQLLERSREIFRQADDSVMQLYTLISMSHFYIERNEIQEIERIRGQALLLSEGKQGQPLEWMLTVFDFSLAVWEEKFYRGISLSRSLKSLALTDEWQWMALFFTSQMYYMLGDLNLAESHIRQALELDMVKRTEFLRGYACLAYAMVLYLKDEQDSHPRIMEEIIAIGEKHDYKYLLGFGKRLAALADYRRHDLENALELLDASTYHFEEIGNTAMASSNMLFRCLWQYPEDSPPKMPAEAEMALKALNAAPSGMCLQEIGLSVFGAIARESGDYELSEKCLTSALEASQAKGIKQVLCGSYLHLAKLYFDMGEQAGGEDYLKQAFDLAAKNKYYMFWDLHHPTLVEMAARCVKKGHHMVYVQELITRYYGREAAEFFVKTTASITATGFHDYTQSFIMRYSVRDDSPDFIVSVNLLGRLTIRINSLTIPDDQWKTKKIAGILKFLVAHRGQPVSKDRLMEVFWPDADKKSAMMSLRAAHYELKKVLRRHGLEADSLALFLKEKRDTLEVLSGRYLVVDVDTFLELADKAQLLSHNKSSPAQKKALLKKIVDLYRGGFLEEDLYEDWTFSYREELCSVYFRSALELAALHLTDRETRKAEKLLLKLLSLDQYNEDACLLLLKLYYSENQRGRAVRLYADFVRRFEKDLQIKPDPRLAAVINEQA